MRFNNYQYVVCISEYCYELEQYGVYLINERWTDNTISLEGKQVRYSEKHFITLEEYRLLKLKKIKDVYKKRNIF